MKIISTLLLSIFCNVQLAAGTFTNPANGNNETFFPPCNLQGGVISFEFVVLLEWEAPGTCEPDSLPLETAGYRIYRDEVMIAEMDGDKFWFIDSGNGSYLEPGVYSYAITALYEVGNDLLESEQEGPVEIVVETIVFFVNGFVWECNSYEAIAGATVTIGECTTTTLNNGTFTCFLVLPFDSITGHVSAPDYYDTSRVWYWGLDWFNTSFSFCITPCGVLGTSFLDDKIHEITVFPVPANDILNVHVDGGIRQVGLINFSGQSVFEVQKSGKQSAQVDVSHSPAGIYTLQVITMKGRILSRKVVISR